MNGSGNVYFVRCGDFVKVGFAVDVDSRVAELQTGNPHKLQMMAVLTDVLPSTERLFHRVMHEYRHRGEWFRLDEAVCRLISHIASGNALVTEPQIRYALMEPVNLPEPLRDVFVRSFIYGQVDRTACQDLRMPKREFRARREAIEKILEDACL
jgi:hypothetical protein